MLLNTVLTVRAHQANSHRGIGWEEFTDAAIRILDQQDRPMVFLLWGTTGSDEKIHAAQKSEASDPGSTASKSAFRISRIFWLQTISARQMNF